MQKYKTYRAMIHKMSLRGQYCYRYKERTTFPMGHPIQDYYSYEKIFCKDQHRTCQSAFFTYDVKIPIWHKGNTYWQGKYGKPKEY